MPSNKLHTRISKKIMGFAGYDASTGMPKETISELNAIIDAPSRDFAGRHREYYHDNISLLLPVVISKLPIPQEQKILLSREVVKLGSKSKLNEADNGFIRTLMICAILGGSVLDGDFKKRYLAAQLHIKTDSFFDRVFK